MCNSDTLSDHCLHFVKELKLKCICKQSCFISLKIGKSAPTRNYLHGFWFCFFLWIPVVQKEFISAQRVEQPHGNGVCKRRCEGREGPETWCVEPLHSLPPESGGAPVTPGGSWGSTGYSADPLWLFEALSKMLLGESPCGEHALNSRAMFNKSGTKVTEQLAGFCIIATKKNYVAPGTKCLRILLKQMFAGCWVIQIIVGSLLPGNLPYSIFF